MSDRGDIRQLIASRLDAVTGARVDELVAQAFESEKKAWGTCPNCRSSVPVTVSDVVACAKAIDLLATQSLGRPGQSVGAHAGAATAERPVRELTLRELELELDFYLERSYAADPEAFLRDAREAWREEDEWRARMAANPRDLHDYRPLTEAEKLERLPPSLRSKRGVAAAERAT